MMHSTTIGCSAHRTGNKPAGLTFESAYSELHCWTTCVLLYHTDFQKKNPFHTQMDIKRISGCSLTFSKGSFSVSVLLVIVATKEGRIYFSLFFFLQCKHPHNIAAVSLLDHKLNHLFAGKAQWPHRKIMASQDSCSSAVFYEICVSLGAPRTTVLSLGATSHHHHHHLAWHQRSWNIH